MSRIQPTRGHVPIRGRLQWALPLVPVAASGFMLSAMTWLRLDGASPGQDHNFVQRAIVGAYQLFGFEPLFMVAVLVLAWSSIWFLTGRVDRPLDRLARIAGLGVCLAVLVNLRADGSIPSGGGDLGATLASRMNVVFAPTISMFVVACAALAALLLATDFFFYRYFDRVSRRRSSRRVRDTAVEVDAVRAFEELRLDVPLAPEPRPATAAPAPAPSDAGPATAADRDPDAGAGDRAPPARDADASEPRRDVSAADEIAASPASHGQLADEIGFAFDGGPARVDDALTDDVSADDAPADDRPVDVVRADDPSDAIRGRNEDVAASLGSEDGPSTACATIDDAPAAVTPQAADGLDAGAIDAEASDSAGVAPPNADGSEPVRTQLAQFDGGEAAPGAIDGPEPRAEVEPDDRDTDLDEPVYEIARRVDPDLDDDLTAEPELGWFEASPMVPDDAVAEPAARVPQSSMFEEARELVVEYRRASANFLRRRLRISTEEAMDLLQDLARDGVIECEAGASQGRVLVEPGGR